MTEIERSSTDIFERARIVEEVGLLHLKGYKNTDIAELTGLANATVRDYIAQYKRHIEKQAEDDPYFLEKVQYNTIKVLNEMEEISKEAWESVEIATREGQIASRNQALKLALDIATKKAQLHNLMGGQKADGEYIARMQKAETVNQLLSKVIRDVIGQCEHCQKIALPMLREAFAMMNTDGADPVDDDDDEIIDVDVVDGDDNG